MVANQKTSDKLLRSALRYHDNGLTVIPCGKDKRPLIKAWQEIAPTAEDVEGWWRRWPEAMIGIRNDGLLIIDIDPLPDGRPNPWPEDADKREELFMSAGAVVRSPRGGTHLWFRRPPDRDWKPWVGQLGGGVDLRTGHGAFIIAPPSQSEGGKYELVDGEIGPAERMPLPPGWVVDALDRLAAKRSGGQPGARNGKHDPSAVVEGGIIGEGKRNSTLASIGGALRRRGLNEPEVEAALAEVNRRRCRPPLDEGEVRRIAQSVSRYAPAYDLAGGGEPEGGESRYEPDLVPLSAVEPETVPWLWPGRIPLRGLTLLVGRPGAGKSFVSCDLAARVSVAGLIPVDGGFFPGGDVLLLNAEDDPAAVLRPRLENAGADLARVHLLRGATAGEKRRPVTIGDIELIEAAIARIQEPRLVVVDPVGAFWDLSRDSYHDAEVRSLLAPLAELSQRRNVAVLIVAHTRKAAAVVADDSPLGSRAFVGVARSVLHLCADPEDRTRRLLLPGKNNLAKRPPGLAFRIEGAPARVCWDPDPLGDDFDADSILTPPPPRRPDRGPAAVKRDAATIWLEEFLRPGPRQVEEVREEARAAGFGWATVRRAREALGVEAVKLSFAQGWVWRLPDEGHDAPKVLKFPCSEKT